MKNKKDPRKWAAKRRRNFAELVIKLRLELGLSTYDAAVRACVAPNTWSRWENERCVPHRAKSRAALVRMAYNTKYDEPLREVLRG